MGNTEAVITAKDLLVMNDQFAKGKAAGKDSTMFDIKEFKASGKMDEWLQKCAKKLNELGIKKSDIFQNAILTNSVNGKPFQHIWLKGILPEGFVNIYLNLNSFDIKIGNSKKNIEESKIDPSEFPTFLADLREAVKNGGSSNPL